MRIIFILDTIFEVHKKIFIANVTRQTRFILKIVYLKQALFEFYIIASCNVESLKFHIFDRILEREI